MNIFFTSDTHFGHANILKYEKDARPFDTVEEMNAELIRRWNSVVKTGDIVWHLGDVFLGGKHNINIISSLNGRKKLIMGNHDHYGARLYEDNGFEKVHGIFSYNSWILSHVPVDLGQMTSTRFSLNIHGHIHSGWMKDDRYFNVSVEEHKLTPVNINEIKKYAERVRK